MYRFVIALAIFLFPVSHCGAQDYIKQLQYDTTIQPLLQKYCADCHETGTMKGLDFLEPLAIAKVAKQRDLFTNVFAEIEGGQMPPADSPQPTELERKQILQWYKSFLKIKPSETDRIARYVVDVFEDKKGHLWIGTVGNGVARHDGTKLTYFTTKDGLPSNTVSSIAQDKDGTLWFGTHDGVCRLEGNRFIRQGIAEGLPARSNPSPIASGSVNVDPKGNLWVSVGQGVYQYKEKKFTKFNAPKIDQKIQSYAILPGQISFQIQDKKGNLWFATDGEGAYKFDGKTYTRYTKADGLCSNNITSIIEDQKGNIWFTCIQSFRPKRTGDGGLVRFDGKKFHRFENVKGLNQNDLYSIYETKSGDIWIGASGVGAYRYDGKTFKLFPKTDHPSRTRHFGLQDIFQSRDGTLWFGFSGGLFRFNGKSFYNITKKALGK